MLGETRNFVSREIQGDADTPISLYLKVNGKKKVLFESNAKHEESGRYSFIALNPIKEILGKEDGFSLVDQDGHTSHHPGSVIEELKRVIPIHPEKYPFPFFGGAIGYFGYEYAFFHEDIGEQLVDPLQMPDIHVLFYDTFIVYDHLRLTITIATIDLFQEGRQIEAMTSQVEEMIKQLQKAEVFQVSNSSALYFQPQLQKNEFIQMIETVKEHIQKGDIFQGVLSQRFSSPFNGDPFSLYRQLRAANPSPYMFYMDLEDYVILGTSQRA